jgi:type IV secretory pathway VirB10-like protein
MRLAIGKIYKVATMQKNNVNHESGLPEIAQQLATRKKIVICILGVIVIAAAWHLVSKRSRPAGTHPIEESYTVQSSIDDASLKPPAAIKDPKIMLPVKTELTDEQISLLQAKQAALQQRLSAPLMMVNNTNNQQQAVVSSSDQSGARSLAIDRNAQFMNQASAVATPAAQATKIAPLSHVIAEGSLIHAILESATNSDLPGYIRATVSSPTYSEDGSTLLIPRGSRLIGQYRSGMLQGQSRICLIWTRLITPNGISIQLGSPGDDNLGVAGLGADEINRHFWQRFGTASLLSIIGTGAATGSASEGSISAYRTAMSNSFAQSANQSLEEDSKISPTLATHQGKPVIVFAAKDLNFQNVFDQSGSTLNVF